jgi:flagellar motor switch protein FliN
MASALLGAEPEEVEPHTEIRDLLVEIAGIVAGNLKSALNDAGRPCALSMPSVASGTDFSVRPLNMDRFERYAFQKDDHVVIVEVGLKEQEGFYSGIDFGSPDGAGRMPMADLEKLDSLDYNSWLAGAVVDVFSTMFSLQLERVETMAASGLDGMRCIPSVCFAGDATGIVSLHIGQELSRLMAANMPGREPEEIDDMLGELATIVGGNLKSALTDTGLRCSLSTPSFTIGSDFRMECLNLERFERLAFRCENHIVLAEMGLKISELVKTPAPTVRDVHPRFAETAADATQDRAVLPAAASTKAAFQPVSEPEASGAEKTQPAPEDFDLQLLLDIPVELTVELGRTKMSISELLKLQPGSAVKLSDLEGDPVDILANDVLIARGEVVVRNEKYGIRITEITSRVERLKGLK